MPTLAWACSVHRSSRPKGMATQAWHMPPDTRQFKPDRALAWARHLASRAPRPLGAPSRRRCARTGSPRLLPEGSAGTARTRRTAPQRSGRKQDWFRWETWPATPPARASATSGDRVAGLLACGHATAIWGRRSYWPRLLGRFDPTNGSVRLSFPLTAAGPLRILTGFPSWPASAGHPRSSPCSIGPAPADSSKKCPGFRLDFKGGLLTCWADGLY